MEFDSEEQKQIYDKCKYIVKLWEHKFKKQKGRLPSRLDIREANSDVRNAYKTYYYLKTKTLEKSFSNLDGFNFDDDDTCDDTNESGSEQTKENLKINSVTNYIRCQSFSENAQHILSDSTGENKQDLQICTEYVIEPSLKNHADFEQNDTQTKTKDVSSHENVTPVKESIVITEKKHAKSYLNTTSSKFTKRNPRKSFIRTSSLSKSNESITDSTPPGGAVLQVLTLSQCANVESENISTCLPMPEKSFAVRKSINQLHSISLVNDILDNKSKPLRSVDSDWLDRISKNTCNSTIQEASLFEEVNENLNTNTVSHTLTNHDSDMFDSDHIIEDSEDEVEYPPKKKQKVVLNKTSFANLIADEAFATDLKPIVSSTTEASLQERAPVVDPPCGMVLTSPRSLDSRSAASLVDKPSPELTSPQSLEIQSPRRSCRNKNTMAEAANKDAAIEELLKQLYEDPVLSRCSVKTKSNRSEIETKSKTPTKAVPSGKSPKVASRISEKTKRSKEIFEKKVNSGNLNENFIRVNLKKKTYSRGKKNVNFSRYKTRQWKKRKAQFSNNFDPAESLLPIEACDADDLMTLEEASKESELDIKNMNFEEFMNTEVLENLENDIQSCSRSAIVSEFEVSHFDPVEPLYEEHMNEGTSAEVYKILKQFGYSSFRPGQEVAIRRILQGKSTLVTLSTGSGKSLCYLLPAYMYSLRKNCITLVVSPLVSLMDDQVANVPPFIKAACYHTNQTTIQRDKVRDAVAAGKISILFVSPELLVSGERNEGLKSILKILPPIAFACIDEAHCVSQWSHNFRPSYLLLCKILRESLNVKTLLGLTATATKATCNSIREHFNITDDEGIITDIPIPDNLDLTVSKVANKEEYLLKLLTSEEFAKYSSIIVYCTRREECERVAAFLRTSLQNQSTGSSKRKRMSAQAECYHAGLSASRRRTVQKAFMSGDLRIVVATVAFGMGINKSDIRAVVHYSLPRNVESYVQEVGRAGRDRLPAHCHVFLDTMGADRFELRRHAYGDSIDRHIIRKLLRKVFVPCKCGDVCPKHEICFSIKDTVQDLDVPEENIATVLCYLELHEKKYINMLSPAYSNCKITYPKILTLKNAAKSCLPLAKALSLYPDNVKDNMFEFPVMEIASAIGWNSGSCKHNLKNLEWTIENNKSKRSALNVQFSILGFHMSAPGNLSKSELDDILNSIYDQTVQNENTSLLQLEAINSILLEAEKEKVKDTQSDLLKKNIRDYFQLDNPLESFSITEEDIDEDRLVNDIHAIISIYRDTTFTGRAIARIFHGIQSPNFPAYSWGRTKFWRSHTHVNFHSISKIATREILALQ